MPPKRKSRRSGGIVARTNSSGMPLRTFVLPGGRVVRSAKYGGNFQNGSGWFSDLAGKVRRGLEGVWNTGKKVYEVAKKINPSKYLEMTGHPAAMAAASNLKKVGLREGGSRRVMARGNAAALLR